MIQQTRKKYLIQQEREVIDATNKRTHNSIVRNFALQRFPRLRRPSTLPSDITSGSVKGIYWDKEFWIEFTLTDFPNVGLPRKEYNLNSTITDLQESAATTQ